VRTVAIALLVVSTGCRLGFDGSHLERDDAPVDDDASGSDDDAGPTDSMMVDVPPNAVTVTFGERASSMVKNATADTYISNDTGEPTFNYGVSDDLRAEADKGERILFRFDVSSIPSSATVIAATLEVDVTQNNSADVEVRPILEPWLEGTLDGTSGQPSYLERSLGTAWATTGCGSPDSAGTTITTFKPLNAGVNAVALPGATVQGWVTSPATNYGIILFNTDTNSVRLASSEDPVAQRPELTVTYLP